MTRTLMMNCVILFNASFHTALLFFTKTKSCNKNLFGTQRLLTPIWEILGTSGSVISGQKDRLQYNRYTEWFQRRVYIVFTSETLVNSG